MQTTTTAIPTRCNALLTALLVGLALLTIAAPGASQASSDASLDDLSWLAGHWRTDEDVYTEELWTEPAGGLMLALNRQLLPGRTAAFEYLRIEERPDGLVYLASPGGKPPTPFPLARLGDRHVVFQNPEHDWPQVLEYRLDEEGVLHVRAAGIEAGSQEFAFTMRRVE